MTKKEYIIKQISKTNKKNFENYVVTRIWHGINQIDVKFITQQYVRRPSGYALTDMFFPQFNLHIEVDEPFHQNRQKIDLSRETDIVDATHDHKIKRIKMTNDIRLINNQIDEIIEHIIKLRKTQVKQKIFEPWNLKKEFDPNYYRKKGYLDISENPAFGTILDACNCLGQNYKACQLGGVKSKVYKNYYLWFPKFYKNKEWDNSLSEDGKTITERCIIKNKQDAHYRRITNGPRKRVVFPRSIDNLGFKLYRFKGVFETDIKKSNKNVIIYRRINTRFELIK